MKVPQSRSDEILKSAHNLLENKNITFNKDSFTYKNELISGRDYRIISFNQKDKTIDIIIVEDNDSLILNLRDDFIKKKTLKSFLAVCILIFLTILIILFFVPAFSGRIRLFLFSLPIAFGYFLYRTAYNTAKNYFKKITDTVTFFSAALTAAAVLSGLNLPQYLYDQKSNLTLQIILFVLLQSFSIFATTKCCISWDETIEESRKYYQENLKKPKGQKKPGLFKRFNLMIFGAILYMKTTISYKK